MSSIGSSILETSLMHSDVFPSLLYHLSCLDIVMVPTVWLTLRSCTCSRASIIDFPSLPNDGDGENKQSIQHEGASHKLHASKLCINCTPGFAAVVAKIHNCSMAGCTLRIVYVAPVELVCPVNLIPT